MNLISSESVRKPCAIVVPNGPCAARSGSTWIHWWSPVASANSSIRSCVISSQPLGPKVSPTSTRASLRALAGGELVQLVVGGTGTRHECRLQTPQDRLLRDHTLGDVLARGKLEHDVEQSVLDDRAQAAGTGLAFERLVGDLPERVVGEDQLDRVVVEEALVLLDERVLRLLEDLD